MKNPIPRYGSSFVFVIAAGLTTFVSLAPAHAQSVADLGPKPYDMLTYEELMRLPSYKQRQYVADIRKMLVAVSGVPHMVGGRFVVDANDGATPSAYQTWMELFDKSVVQEASADPYDIDDFRSEEDKANDSMDMHCPNGDEQVNVTTWAGWKNNKGYCNHVKASGGEAGKEEACNKDGYVQVRDDKAQLVCMRAQDYQHLQAMKPDQYTVEPKSKPIADAAATREKDGQKLQCLNQAVKGKKGSDEYRYKMTQALTQYKTESKRASQCVYAGFIKSYVDEGDQNTPDIPNTICHGRTSTKIGNLTVACTDAEKKKGAILCNPMLFGIVSQKDDSSASGICVPKGQNATKSCAARTDAGTRSASKKRSPSADSGTKETYQEFFSKNNVGNSEEWNKLKSSIHDLCHSSSGDLFHSIHCAECGVMDQRIEAANAGVGAPGSPAADGSKRSKISH